MKRFFGKSENIHDDYIIIDGTDVNHIRNVLRMKKGDELTVCGGNNTDYICSIREYGDDIVCLDIKSRIVTSRELPSRIHLFQGLPKSDKMELIIQKCVELGVYEIIPVSMKRCVVKLDNGKSMTKIARWQAISESAAKQSGRTIIPRIQHIMTFEEALEYSSSMDLKIIPYELCEGMESIKDVFGKMGAGMDVSVFIGPEGGIDISEIDAAKNSGMIPVSLGKRILRTETAGLAFMAAAMYHLEAEI